MGNVTQTTFDDASGMDDTLNRVTSISDTSATLAEYTYLGAGTVVRITYPEPEIWLDLWGGTSGVFNGIDRFNRVIDQRWQNQVTTTPTDIDRYQYGYDQNSNRLFKANVVGTAAVTSGLDEYYSYDPLNRLTEMQRGVLNGTNTGITGTPSAEQDWTLDPTGNWSEFVEKASGTTTLDQTRAASTVNQITNIAATTGPTWVTPSYDAAGNTTTMPQPADPTSSFTAVYDAWNRMTSISAGSTPVGGYQYDGRNFRIVKQTYTSGTLSETRDFYFTAAWQDIEEQIGGVTANQYVYGIRYIDELICRDDPTFGRLYATQDANFNLTSIANSSGSVVERYLFAPYGDRRIMDASWGVIGDSAYDWLVGFQGLPYDANTGLIDCRSRVLPSLGGFASRDPYTNGDGGSLYEFVESNPIVFRDPLGLFIWAPPAPPAPPPSFLTTCASVAVQAAKLPVGNVARTGGIGALAVVAADLVAKGWDIETDQSAYNEQYYALDRDLVGLRQRTAARRAMQAKIYEEEVRASRCTPQPQPCPIDKTKTKTKQRPCTDMYSECADSSFAGWMIDSQNSVCSVCLAQCTSSGEWKVNLAAYGHPNVRCDYWNGGTPY